MHYIIAYQWPEDPVCIFTSSNHSASRLGERSVVGHCKKAGIVVACP